MSDRNAWLTATSARRVAVCAAVLVSAALPLSVSAGIVVTNAGGSIAFDYESPTDPPQPTSLEFTGLTGAFFEDTFSGGSGGVSIQTNRLNDEELQLVVQTTIESTGIAPDALSRFVLEFETDRPLPFTFLAHPPGRPQSFQASLDGFVANATSDSLGNGFGSIPFDADSGTFGNFLRTGTLPAGSHHFVVESAAFSGKTGGGASDGFATIEVNATAIPLPSAAWTGLSVMAGLVLAHALRARRAART